MMVLVSGISIRSKTEACPSSLPSSFPQGKTIMPLFFILLFLGGLIVVCELVGLVAFSVVMAAFACVMAGLTAGLIGTLVLTNVYKMNYETAFTRSFWGGTALAALIVVVWTAVLDLLAGGLTTALVAHLWLVSLDCALYSFIVAVVTMVTWGVMIFTNGRKHRG